MQAHRGPHVEELIVYWLRKLGRLTARQLCVLINDKTYDYCRKISCHYYYRRKYDNPQKPDCNVSYTKICNVLKSMENRGIVVKYKALIKDVKGDADWDYVVFYELKTFKTKIK